MTQKAVARTVFISLLACLTVYGQNTGLKGRVVDTNNSPISGAQVKLVKANKSQTTDQSGNFFIDMTSIRAFQAEHVFNSISFQNGILSFFIPENSQNIQIEVFDIKGQSVSKQVYKGICAGTFSITILPENLPVSMYFVKIRIANRSHIFNVMKLKKQSGGHQVKGQCVETAMSKQAVASTNVIDTLVVTKDPYQLVRTAITSYASNLPDIVLKKEFELPPITNGKSAKTTRYWDCCKPHCGWHSNMKMCDISGNELNDRNAKSGCEGGPAFQCMDYAPFAVSSKVSYGWAAFNNSGTQCGDCFQLAFQGSLSGKQMIVQVINIGNGGTDAFDLLIPGGGVGAMNGCSRQWNNAPLGAQYGGFRATCGANKDCILNMCKAAFGDKKYLMAGCEWYCGWFGMGDNPAVTYMKVSCPKEIKDISRIGN
jgi:hypothetical protein